MASLFALTIHVIERSPELLHGMASLPLQHNIPVRAHHFLLDKRNLRKYYLRLGEALRCTKLVRLSYYQILFPIVCHIIHSVSTITVFFFITLRLIVVWNRMNWWCVSNTHNNAISIRSAQLRALNPCFCLLLILLTIFIRCRELVFTTPFYTSAADITKILYNQNQQLSYCANHQGVSLHS